MSAWPACARSLLAERRVAGTVLNRHQEAAEVPFPVFREESGVRHENGDFHSPGVPAAEPQAHRAAWMHTHGQGLCCTPGGKQPMPRGRDEPLTEPPPMASVSGRLGVGHAWENSLQQGQPLCVSRMTCQDVLPGAGFTAFPFLASRAHPHCSQERMEGKREGGTFPTPCMGTAGPRSQALLSQTRTCPAGQP